MPLPLPLVVPTAVPPLVQVVGASPCGPKTVNVIVPPAPTVPPESPELMELATMALPAVPLAGALTVVTVVFLTTVEAIPDPQVLLEALLLESPP